jgi:hypothetical protein
MDNFRVDANFHIRLTSGGFRAMYFDAVGEMVVDTVSIPPTESVILAQAGRLPEGWDA